MEEEDCVVDRWGLKKVLGRSGQAWSGFGVKVNGISTAYLGEGTSLNLEPGRSRASWERMMRRLPATLELELLLLQSVQLMDHGPRGASLLTAPHRTLGRCAGAYPGTTYLMKGNDRENCAKPPPKLGPHLITALTRELLLLWNNPQPRRPFRMELLSRSCYLMHDRCPYSSSGMIASNKGPPDWLLPPSDSAIPCMLTSIPCPRTGAVEVGSDLLSLAGVKTCGVGCR